MTASPTSILKPSIESVQTRLRNCCADLGVSVVAEALPESLMPEFTLGGLAGMRQRAVVSWEHAASGTRLFGFGVAARIGAARGSARVLELLSGLSTASLGVVPHEARPRFFGGHEFDKQNPLRDPRWDAFGSWQFILPEVLIAALPDGNFRGTVCAFRGDDQMAAQETPAHTATGRGLGPSDWMTAVRAGVQEIRAGRYGKMVLARQVTQRMSQEWSRERTVTALADAYPGCYVFQFQTPGGTFLGASPERLVSLDAGVARADSLAGTRRRGRTDTEDLGLERDLFTDRKEREEHTFVVQAIAASLREFSTKVDFAEEPTVMKLATIQHLHTPVTAEVKPGVTVLDLVKAMHPTPAVGGWPRADALDAIRRLEKMDRGWYASPIGWVDFDGNGEFAVALRSALVCGNEATLFAGAGIVADSDAARECSETELKMKPLDEALRKGGAWT